MKFLFFLFLILHIGCKIENQQKYRLTYVQSFYPENTLYLFNSEEEFIKHGFFEKDEKIYSSGKYSYKWANQDKNTYINLVNFLPEPNEKNYRDFSIYDSLYINIYSKKKTGSTFIIIINCQEREPDSVSSSTNAYISYLVTMNFKGWKEFKINFADFSKNYSPDITKVTSVIFNTKGWNQVPDPTSIINIDKLFITKAKYEFNMNENEISQDNYLNIINRMIYVMTYTTLDESKTKIAINRAQALVREAKNNQLKINKEGLPFDYKMSHTSDITSIYGLIRSMAIGYITEGGELYKNKELLEDILYALEYMHENYYNRREEKPFGSNDNWWDWEIGTAEKLIDILFCLSNDIPQELIDKYLEPINRYDPFPSMTMSNRINVAYSSIFSGVLQKDYKKIVISIEMFRECFNTVEISDGFYDDGTFIQHIYYPYVGGYGDELMTALSIISYSLDDSVFRLEEKMIKYQYQWIINSYLPFIYNGGYTDIVRGRSVSRNVRGDQSGKSIMNTLCLMVDYLTEKDDINYIKQILKEFYQLNKPYLMYVLTPASLIKLEELEKDNNIIPNKINDFAKVFSRGDIAISQVNNVAIGISMSSSRIGKYESINGENTKGWYSGDGMVYIYLNVNDYASNYWKNVNYYRLQGTTVTNAKRVEKGYSGQNSLAKYDFVGGAYSKLNMVAAMTFASESPKIGFNSTLVGNKAYFVFGEKLICLGNSINSEDNYGVETIIENRNLTGKLYFGDKEINDKTGNVNSNYIYIENYGGIYVPEYKKLKFNITNNNFLEIYFEHGIKIKDEKYIYMIFPTFNKNNLKENIDNIEILSNNNIVSAVKDKKLNVIEYVFWQSGKLNDISVDSPCILLIEDGYIYASDPTQKLEYLTVSVGNDHYQLRVKKGYTNKIKIK